MDHQFRALSERLRGLFGGRQVVLAGGTRLSRRVQELHHLGADRTLVISTDDSAPLYDPQVATWLTLGISGLIATEQMGLEEALSSPAPELAGALREFDPTGDALVIGSHYMALPEVGGRPVLNCRKREWVALENKTTIDSLWRDLSVPHAPAAVFDAAGESFSSLWEALDAATLQRALEDFASRERRFGLTGAQSQLRIGSGGALTPDETSA